jgi:acyl-CoA synthetase (AMP-forming)/AMP-acid ligase II
VPASGSTLSVIWQIEKLLGKSDSEPIPPKFDLAPDHPAIILYTSGTTAFPKGVVQSHGNLIANAWSMVKALCIDTPVQYSVMPFYHSHAVGFGMMTCLLSRGHLIVADKMNPAAWKKVVRSEGVTISSMVPNLLRVLLRSGIHRSEVPSLKQLFVSAAPLPRDLAHEFEHTSGIKIAHAWGLSEFTNFATCLSPHLEELSREHLMYGYDTPCVGKSLDGVDVQVAEKDGTEASEGALGELRVRGPSRMLGYDQNPQATQQTIRDGWLYSGDEGFYVREGSDKYFFITDRIKDVVSRAGEKVSPTAVEVEIAKAIPQLSGAIVALGFPHDLYGEEIGLVVQVENFEKIQVALENAIGALPTRIRPKIVLHGEAIIPRTHTGKVQRRLLVPLFKHYQRSASPLTIAEVFPEGAAS